MGEAVEPTELTADGLGERVVRSGVGFLEVDRCDGRPRTALRDDRVVDFFQLS